MYARCVTTRPWPADFARPYLGQWVDLSGTLIVGKEYLVYGMEIRIGQRDDDPPQMPTANLLVIPEHGYFVSLPLAAFEITDPRVSRYWEARVHEGVELLLYPPVLFELFYEQERSPGEEGDEEYFAAAAEVLEQLRPLLTAEGRS